MLTIKLASTGNLPKVLDDKIRWTMVFYFIFMIEVFLRLLY